MNTPRLPERRGWKCCARHWRTNQEVRCSSEESEHAMHELDERTSNVETHRCTLTSSLGRLYRLLPNVASVMSRVVAREFPQPEQQSGFQRPIRCGVSG